MGFREWWTKHSILVAFIIGASVGLILYFTNFYFEDSNFADFFWSLGIIPFCKLTLSEGEGCAIAFGFIGWLPMMIGYGGLTALCWIIFQKLKRK